ncbi:MAG: DNA-processing protein DprA [Candidatus Nealsonbacteria bacterium]|nr:DNA-processing protein DprA [Candidatus Nealsonbacteria bacterium]
MKAQRIEPGDRTYPPILVERLADTAPQNLYALGDPGILRNQLLGLICSIQCPGSIIIKTFDVIRGLRDEKVIMIGGFHSPMERECLDLLLRGAQPVILCPARSLRNLRMGKAARKALSEGRLLVLSFFGDEVRRATSAQAILRNDRVAALAEAILVPHASKNGKTWTTVRRVFESGQKVFTFEDETNTDLIASGARACRSSHLDELVNEIRRIK